MQDQLLGISLYSAVPIAAVVPAEFLYDVEYINSPLLTRMLEQPQYGWTSTPYQSW